MTADAALVVQALFNVIWSLFTSWTIPGFNVTPMEFAIFGLFMALVIRFIKRLLAKSGGGDED